MRDWWTAEDGKEYERRSEVMVTQAEAFSVHGVSLKGKLTCGENIADLGGLKLAYKALMKVLVADDKEGGKARLPINGFKPEQRFFLAWSQCWRENVRKERALQLITLDPHGPK
jgi:putative endopeptidase